MRRRKDFSLIELLVVIAIIALLSALLFPALKKAKDAAKTILCNGNLKQLGMGMQTYTMDYREYFPLQRYTANYIAWDDLIMDYVGSPIWTNAQKSAYCVLKGKNSGITPFVCPADLSQTMPAAISYFKRSYGINSSISGSVRCGIGGNDWSTRISAIKSTSNIIALAELHSVWSLIGCPDSSNVNGLLPGAATGLITINGKAHGNISYNYLFCDGHVAFINANDTYTNSNKNMWDIRN